MLVKKCADCGKDIEVETLRQQYCNECALKRDIESKARSKKKSQEKRAKGLCCYSKECTNLAVPGKRVCQEHLEAYKKAGRARRARLGMCRATAKPAQELPQLPQEQLKTIEDTVLNDLINKLHTINEQIKTLKKEKESIIELIKEKLV